MSAAEAKTGCNDPNEDARAQHKHDSGCTAEHRATYADPLYSATAGEETCWVIKSFADPKQTLGYQGEQSSTLIEPVGDDWSEKDSNR